MANQKIRFALIAHNMKQYKLAQLLSIDEHSLSRKLRYELPEAEQNQIIAIIESAATAQ